jgi:hypothetical protein
MGDFRKHLNIAEEKLSALLAAYQRKQHSVVGDLGTKVVEQLVEADAARAKKHFGRHQERHDYASEHFPEAINVAMKRVWFAYGDLGYDGANGKRAKEIVESLRMILRFFEVRFGEKIKP